MANHHDTGIRPPAPPKAVRLNKLAAVLAAGCVSATLLVVGLMVGSEREGEAEAQRQREESSLRSRGPARPDFLERPLEEEVAGEDAAPPAAGPEASDLIGIGGAGTAAYVPPSPYGSDTYYDVAAYDESAASGPSPEEQAFDRALRSSLTPQDVRTGAAEGDRPVGSSYDAGSYDADRYLHTLAAVGGAYGEASMAEGAASRPDVQSSASAAVEQPRAFLEAAARSRAGRADRIAGDVQRPAAPYEVLEGTVIEAQLLTAIDSDLPGGVLAQVSRDVYDSRTQQTLLIPRGTRLVGTYDSQTAPGQSRLLVAWTRMILPDGRSLGLPGLASKGMRGATGITGEVDRHRLGAFGDALMLSVVGAGLALSQRRPDRSGSAYPSPGEVLAGSVAAELARVATETVRARAGRSPTIRVRAGAPFYVFVSGDLALPPYPSQDGLLQRAEWP